MGSSSSKKHNPSLGGGGGTNSGSSRGNSSSSSSNKRMEYIGELRTYEADCQQDPELQAFDATVMQRTMVAISILASSEGNSISFETLQQVTGCVLENNKQVVKKILEKQQDTWNNPKLFALVDEYLQNSLQTLDFFTALEKCLKKARDSQLIIHVVLKRFEKEDELSEEEEETGGRDGKKKKYKRTLEELQHFKDAGDPFTQEFFQMFQLVYRRQVSILEKLMQKKKKLDKKLKSVETWRKVSNIIFVSAFAALLVSAMVTAVVAPPPVAAALAAAAAIPLGSVGKWVTSLWEGYSDVLKGERDVLSAMKVGTDVTIAELDSIRLLVDRLEIEIGSLLQQVDFASRDEEGVKFGIEEIQKKLGEFMKGVEDLGEMVDCCTRDIQRARTVVLQKIRKPPKNMYVRRIHICSGCFSCH